MSSFICPRAMMASATLFFHHPKSPARPFLRCLHNSANTISSPICRLPHRKRFPQTTLPTRRTYKTVEEARSRTHSGPFSVRSAVLFITVGACMIVYFRFEKDRITRQKVAEASKGVGKPKVGGKFELVDQEGRRWTEEGLKGGFTLVYFGFTHCPDICPDELDKMARMIDLINGPPNASTAPMPPPPIQSSPTSPVAPSPISLTPRPPLLPIFITCDPARDTPAVLRPYLVDFHPSLIGLTGTWQQVKDACRAYRVYFSTPEGAKPGTDYLVDHSIYFYLMDPDGDFVECLGRQHTPESAAKIIREHMSDWKNGIKLN